MKAGFINYSNSHPFYAAVTKKAYEGLEIIHQVPSILNQRLHEGELALSAISLFEYLKHEEDYWLLPNWCINSRGHVKSVLLYSKVPFEQLSDKKVLLCSESATSNNLLKLLLNHYGISPSLLELPQNEELDNSDAVLLIGDPALNFQNRDFSHIIDLAEEWVKWTSGPVVFAVQALRKDQIKGNEELINNVVSCHSEVLQTLNSNLAQVCNDVQKAYPSMKTDFYDYFKCLNFHLDQSCIKAIERYNLESQKIGTLNHSPQLLFAPI